MQVVASYDFPMLILTALKRLLDPPDAPEGKFSAEYVRREYGITVDDTGAELMTATAPAS